MSGPVCVLASKDCQPPLQWHHAVRQQRLRREFKYGAYWEGRWIPAGRNDPVRSNRQGYLKLSTILGDTRNRIFLCAYHHELVTNGRLKVELPESVYEFAREFGLEATLENDLAKASVSPLGGGGE